MKMLAAVPCALLLTSVLGCSQQASTDSAAARPAATPSGRSAGSDTNTFGESKDPSGDAAAQARDRSWGDADKGADHAPDSSGTPPRQ